MPTMTNVTSSSTDAHTISIEDNPTAVALKSAVGPLTLQTLSKASKIAKRQAAMTLIAYLTLWSPYNMLAMMNTLTNGEIIADTLNFLNALIVVNPVVNPLIYGLF
ncbi:unnamed protein product [Onchocerca ochengi]|uniref:G_PROTEIN_RECEP_F1_2 domain-containing protein n=1 Tax=Onchocerca ochengi TaxID=42157 RepID=A0A182EIG8_ONCOC|nr:unnamed protein product [Onchocerca ochengi]